jgi:hypothetical protein
MLKRRKHLKMGLKEIKFEDVGWIDLTQDSMQRQALVNMIVILQVQLKVGDIMPNQTTTSFSRRTLIHRVNEISEELMENNALYTTLHKIYGYKACRFQ